MISKNLYVTIIAPFAREAINKQLWTQNETFRLTKNLSLLNNATLLTSSSPLLRAHAQYADLHPAAAAASQVKFNREANSGLKILCSILIFLTTISLLMVYTLAINILGR